MKIVNYDDLRDYRRNLTEIDPEVFAGVGKIIADVKTEGDAELIRYTEKFDKARLDSQQLFATEKEFEDAVRSIEGEHTDLIGYFLNAAKNIRAYHDNQRESSWMTDYEGNRLGQLITPIEKIGLYVPGGAAFYPSSLLMNLIPAQVAGVKDITIATPPTYNGNPHPLLLTLARKLGVNKVLKAGGAQAIAALAYGTESVAPVYKITGPGNIYVAAAKQLVSDTVDIDSFAGPSEVVVFADGSANPAWIAADLLAQAEHTGDNAVFVISADQSVLDAVNAELEKQIPTLARAELVRKSLNEQSFAVKVADSEQGFDIMNRLAPEHVQIILDLPDEEILAQVKNAGAVFLGNFTSAAMGDYYVGPNHILPTNGTAVFSSPLGVYDFIKRSSVIRVAPDYVKRYGNEMAEMAKFEGFDAHAASVKARMG